MADERGLIFLNLAGLLPRAIYALIAAGLDLSRAIDLDAESWRAFGILTDKDIARLSETKNSGLLARELDLTAKHGVTVMTVLDERYPALLKEIAQPPPVLYVKGQNDVLSGFALAVVGSRHASNYGINTACELARRMAAAGAIIVSGLARGIDTAAHTGALAYRTVAVLGSGFLNVYPLENRRLADMIARNGAVVSEFPMNTKPLGENFPRRDRIISGLSRGVVVVEAARKSGSLITAGFALEQNREVFAVPGRVNDLVCDGTNLLIQQGAKLVRNEKDILTEFDLCLAKLH